MPFPGLTRTSSIVSFSTLSSRSPGRRPPLRDGPTDPIVGKRIHLAPRLELRAAAPELVDQARCPGAVLDDVLFAAALARELDGKPPRFGGRVRKPERRVP